MLALDTVREYVRKIGPVFAMILSITFGTGIQRQNPASLISVNESLTSFMDFVPVDGMLVPKFYQQCIETMLERCVKSIFPESKASSHCSAKPGKRVTLKKG